MCASRTRRAISCAYWAPKSTTRTVSVMWPASVAHADALSPLQRLAFCLQRRRHHDLCLLEVFDVDIAAGCHRGTQRTEEVHATVVLVGGTDEDFLQRAPRCGLDARTPRQCRVERRHPPVVAAA